MGSREKDAERWEEDNRSGRETERMGDSHQNIPRMCMELSKNKSNKDKRGKEIH